MDASLKTAFSPVKEVAALADPRAYDDKIKIDHRRALSKHMEIIFGAAVLHEQGTRLSKKSVNEMGKSCM